VSDPRRTAITVLCVLAAWGAVLLAATLLGWFP
jgi:hypothetical protein